MVVSQFPSRASNRPYTPIFEDAAVARRQQQALENRLPERFEQEEDDDGYEYGEQFGGGAPEGLQFLW